VKFALKLDVARIRRLSKESFWIVAGQVAAVLGALAGIRVLTELMSPEVYGQLALGMTLALIAGQALIGPLSAGASRFFASASEAGELKPYILGIRKLMWIITIAILLLTVVIVVPVFASAYKTWIPLIVVAVVFALLTGYNNIANGIQNAARQRIVVALHSGLAPWLRILFAVCLIYMFGASSTNVISGYVLATVIILISQYLFFKPVLNTAKHQQGATNNTSNIWQTRIFNYSWPFATWGAFAAVHLASDRWALATFNSQAEVGFFAVLYQLGYYPVALFTEMLYLLITPIIFKRAGDGTSYERLDNAKSLNIKMVLLVLAVTSIIVIGTWIFHELIFSIFVAHEYREVSSLLPVFALSAGVVASSNLLSIERMSALQTKSLIIPKIVAAIIGIVLNILGAYFYGLQGVVFAQLLFSVIYFGWMILQYLTFSKKPALVSLDENSSPVT
jgi:O-antigen/teichoic acid export membrane protein